jgi:hypothetical protein
MADASAALERGGLARGAISLFYVLTTYAGDVFYGPGKFATFGQLNGGSPWVGMARDVWGIGIGLPLGLHFGPVTTFASDDMAPTAAGSMAGQEGA